MPPKAQAKTESAASDLPQGEPGELCTEGCFPDGWGEYEKAMCVHGTWTK